MNTWTERSIKNPLIEPQDIHPSIKSHEVIGVFNAAAILHGNETILILRVAEIKRDAHKLLIPHLDGDNQMAYKVLDPSADTEYDFSDRRFVAFKRRNNNGNVAFLTSLSHFRIARSLDGIHFTIDEKIISPKGPEESFGIEDPRVTRIDGVYHIVYTAISADGVVVALMTTTDFVTFERHGIILPPENKDAALFPEKINGRYYMWHRPVPSGLGGLNMWMASSDNLRDWGRHKCVLKAAQLGFENGRIGAGAPPIRTAKGWLHIYHAADASHRYQLAAFITDLNRPDVITHLLEEPLIVPEMDYETSGFFDDVVFSCGVIQKANDLWIYYGAADSKIALLTMELDVLFAKMRDYHGND